MKETNGKPTGLSRTLVDDTAAAPSRCSPPGERWDEVELRGGAGMLLELTRRLAASNSEYGHVLFESDLNQAASEGIDDASAIVDSRW